MPEFTDITFPIYLVSLLFAAPIPTCTSEIFATCSCTFFINIVYFFFADNGIYEELLVRAKNTIVLHNAYYV